MINDCMAWSNDIFSHCDLGDKRLLKGNNSETVGAYRFVRNESVKPDAIMEGTCAAVVKESMNSEYLLAIEDTTTLSYRHSVRNELGYITNTDAPNSPKGF